MRYVKSFANDSAIQEAVDNKTLGKPYVALNDQTGKIDWNGKEETPDYSKMYLTIEALEDGVLNVFKPCYYSINEGEWVYVSKNATIPVNSGYKLRFKGTVDDSKGMFSGNTIAFNVYGNIMSLKYNDNFSGETTCFQAKGMFERTGVSDASNLILPATILVNNCYDEMFLMCSNLIGAPELPATTLAASCYAVMFYACTSLIVAPELPATTLADNCYSSMFTQSSNLTITPVLPATTLANYCYANMFASCQKVNRIVCYCNGVEDTRYTLDWLRNVSPTGTFVKKAGVTWPTGNSGIPSGWTVIEE